MEIKLNKKDETQATLVVSVKEIDYKEKVKNKLSQYAKKASIKGFRPGKVPVALLQQQYGVNTLVEVVNSLLLKYIDDYLKESNLNIIGKPLPNYQEKNKINWETQKEFEFYYELGLVPDFKVDVNSNIKIDKFVIKADKKAIEDTIKNIQEQSASNEKVDVSKEGDFISGKLTGLNFDKEVLLPTNQLKNEIKKFVGIKSGETVVFDLQKAFDKDASKIGYFTGLKAEETSELKGDYKLVVDSITSSVPAELNQDLFDKIFGKDVVKSKEEFSTKVEETISENYERESENLLFRNLIDQLVQKFDFKLSEEFITKFIKANNNKISDEDLKKSLPSYIHDLKWSLIRAEINKELKVEVPTEIVVESAKARLLAQFNMSSIPEGMDEQFAPIVDNYLKEDNGRNFLNEYENLLTTRILALLVEKITIKEKSISVEDFNKEVSKK